MQASMYYNSFMYKTIALYIFLCITLFFNFFYLKCTQDFIFKFFFYLNCTQVDLPGAKNSVLTVPFNFR